MFRLEGVRHIDTEILVLTFVEDYGRIDVEVVVTELELLPFGCDVGTLGELTDGDRRGVGLLHFLELLGEKPDLLLEYLLYHGQFLHALIHTLQLLLQVPECGGDFR
ncbi:hypothetical protein SDC9_153988 [bioreactor metagenome]|uniref:Uncharacterized protein n=1 Tax=bioreactor metagenome TaxID=1076179 RepID=A0A645EZQ6_9ZZZZ